jgi:hypothetical protein
VRPAWWRVRAGEGQVGIASVALLVVLFALPWYRVTVGRASFFGPGMDRTGWQSLSILGPLCLVVGVVGVGVLVLQAACRAPALPVSATVIETAISLALTIGLLVRVFIAEPPFTVAHVGGVVLFSGHLDGRVETLFGGYVGFVLALLVLIGCYRSLRDDGIAPPDGPGEIELIRIDELASAGSSTPEA